MTAADRPNPADDVSGTGRDEGGRVIPFPPGGRDGLQKSHRRWRFTADVRRVDGTEGDWLRHELARVLRDLLTWAHEDMTGDGAQHDGEERAA